MPIFKEKFRETLLAVLPILFVVLIVHFFFVPFPINQLVRFIIGSLLVMIGLSLFLVGVDLGITPLGSLTGTNLAKTNKLPLILVSAFILGFFISIAEPALIVYANQIELVTQGGLKAVVMLISVSIGFAVLVVIGFIRILFNIDLYKILLVSYISIFGLAIFAKPEFLAFAFDASGATTGVLAVPFLLAISVGIARIKKDVKSAEESSFGMVALASAGAIIAVLVLSYFSTSKAGIFESDPFVEKVGIIKPFIELIWPVLYESARALAPLLVILIVMQFLSFKLNRKQFRRLIFGFIYALLGLFIFLLGVNGGFMEVGYKIGENFIAVDKKVILVILAFFLGLFTIIAEPAVSVLTHQIEEITGGYVKRVAVLIPLSLGVGLAVVGGVLKILIPGFHLWHVLLPGYIISLGLMFFAPKLFVGIAFDAGGVATGPLTATFILAFVQGVAAKTAGADLVLDGFGVIALVALAPIITLQILGIIFKIKTKKGGV